MPTWRFPIRSHTTVAALQALLVTFLWSTSWVLITVGLDEIPALVFAGLRYGIAAVILLCWALLRPGVRRELRALDGRGWGALALLGVVLYAVTQGAQFVGLALLPAATLSLVLSFTPVVVAVAAGAALRERVPRSAATGLVLVTTGAVVYFAAGGGLEASIAGLLVAGVGLVANAAASLLGRRINSHGRLSALAVTAPSMTVGAVLLLVVGIPVQGVPVLSGTAWLIVGVLAVVNTALGFTLWNHTLRTLSATASATINNTMLIQIAILAAVFLGQSLGPLQWAALAVAAVGTALVQRGTGFRTALADDALRSRQRNTQAGMRRWNTHRTR